MGLNAQGMAQAIENALNAMPQPGPVTDPASGATYRNQFILAWCTGIVQHIQQSAQVNVISVAGVTTGSGVSGTGTGTIS